MNCYQNYIGIDRSLASRSGLYVTDLPGVDIRVLDALTKKEQADYTEFWERILDRAWTTLTADLSAQMQRIFHVDYKLLSRETSQFQAEVNDTDERAGILLRFDLPKYAVLHVISVGIIAEESYESPAFTIQFLDQDQNGELLHEVAEEITAGRQVINIDRDFETDQLFVSYDAVAYLLRKTDNKEYNTGLAYWDKVFCQIDCGTLTGDVRQIAGGGLNVKFNVRCSVEKYLCENINLFRTALWWRTGLELVKERRYGNKLNEYTTMSFQDAENMEGMYQLEYDKELKNAIGSQRIYEDPICFQCNSGVSAKTILP